MSNKSLNQKKAKHETRTKNTNKKEQSASALESMYFAQAESFYCGSWLSGGYMPSGIWLM